MNILMFDRTSKRLNELKSNLFEAQSDVIEGFFTSSNAEEALEVFHRHRPEIVIINADLTTADLFIQQTKDSDADIIIYGGNSSSEVRSNSEFDEKRHRIVFDESNLGVILTTLIEDKHSVVKEQSSQIPSKIAVSSLKKIHFIPVGEIVMCKASRQYTEIFLDCGKMILSSKTLSYYQDLLGSDKFLRIHRSYLINLEHVQEFNKQNDEVILSNCNHVKLSYNMKDRFLERMMI